jgi:hypothetical protein
MTEFACKSILHITVPMTRHGLQARMEKSLVVLVRHDRYPTLQLQHVHNFKPGVVVFITVFGSTPRHHDSRSLEGLKLTHQFCSSAVGKGCAAYLYLPRSDVILKDRGPRGVSLRISKVSKFPNPGPRSCVRRPYDIQWLGSWSQPRTLRSLVNPAT